MTIIYEPTGKAREYSPLALNVYNGCDHGCKYCYVQGIKRSTNCNLSATERKNLIPLLSKELSKNVPCKQILLSFMCDPYCSFDIQTKKTRNVLHELDSFGCLVAVLSKGGKRCLRDIDIFQNMQNRFKYGATLTMMDEKQSYEIEPGAAPPKERLAVLDSLHRMGIKTFVSMEPVIDPKQSLDLMRRCLDFVDQFKIGKLNHYENRFNKIDWQKFLYDSVKLMRDNKKCFYIKHDLRAFDVENILLPHECDHDFMALKPENTNKSCADIA